MNKGILLTLQNYVILSCLILMVSCTQSIEKAVLKEFIPVDTTKLYGYWEHKGISYSDFNENKPNFSDIYGENRGMQWIFRKDSIFITDHPIQLRGKRHYIIKQDSIIFPSIYFSPDRNEVVFSGDTLILKGRKGTNVITHYFFKSKHEKTELDFLISEKVNWSLFTNQILINVNQKDLKDSLFPYISYLDLRESNSNNFSTSQDTLFYRDSIGNHSFRFRIDSDLDGSLNLIYLNDTVIERVLFFKTKN